MKPHIAISTMEMNVIDAIVNRALIHFPDRVASDIKMDLISTHLRVPLRLNDLLDTDDFNFIHDIVGIERHLNRGTLRLQDGFMPRFAAS